MAEKKINGRLFQVGHVLATDSIRLQMRIMKIVGGAVGQLPAIFAGMGQKGEENPEAKVRSDAAVTAALNDVVRAADPDVVTQLLSDIVAMARVKTQSGSWETLDIDQDFTDDKKSLIPLAVFVLQEVLGDFFGDALGSGMAERAKKVMGGF